MSFARTTGQFSLAFTLGLTVLLILSGCVRPDPTAINFPGSSHISPGTTAELTELDKATPASGQMGTVVPEYVGQPTADAPHYEIVQADVSSPGHHIVAAGETLGTLAQRYDTTVEELMNMNELTDPDLVHAGQELQVPGVETRLINESNFKIVPDSELVYGPTAKGFDVRAFTAGLGSYLASHKEEVEGQAMDGPAILQLVADRYSINPRLLLAVLEYQTQWVSKSSGVNPVPNLGYSGAGAPGLYGQLSWAANLLSLGYYGRAEGGLRSFNLDDGTLVTFSPIINDGTAGVQRFFGAIDGATTESWQQDVSSDGFYKTYNQLFDNPFAYTFEPILPAELTPPEMELPWAAGETWYFTGGPHGAWNSGTAWGALDFVPPAEQAGCIQSDNWVTSMTAGRVVRSGHGAVVIDLDDDGYPGTGWAITYMHLETRDRAPLGTEVNIGDQLGHPSCEGGFSNGTHVHISRSYNGRWISADGTMPFIMSGWVSSGAGAEYDGFLTRGNAVRGACVCRDEVNAVNH